MSGGIHGFTAQFISVQMRSLFDIEGQGSDG
jgi:hypothetical protein